MKTKSRIISSLLAIFILSLTSCSEETNELNLSSRYSEHDKAKIVETIANDLGADIKYDREVTKKNAIVFET
jgi:hypothetical protein